MTPMTRAGKRFLFPTLILCSALLRSSPPSEDIHLVHLTREDGLSSSSVFEFIQDRYGFMWMATESGLNRFDGNEFSVYRPVPGDPASLSHSYILTVREDKDGIIWIGTYNGGLNRFDPLRGEFRRYRHVPGRPDSLSNDTSSFIYEDRSGELWIGTDNGLDRFDRRSGRFIRYPLAHSPADNAPGDHVHCIHEDREGALWIATYGDGIFRLDRATGTCVQYRHDPAVPHSLSSDLTSDICEDRDGALWIGTDDGLNRLDTRSGRFSRIPLPSSGVAANEHGQFNALCKDRRGRLWIGSKEGLFILDSPSPVRSGSSRGPAVTRVLASDQIFSLYEDHAGIIWIGTNSDGIYKHDPRRKKFSHYGSIAGRTDSLGCNQVNSFWEDAQGGLWIGTREGLERLDLATSSFAHFRSAPGDPQNPFIGDIRCILADRGGTIWLGTDGDGIKRFDRASGRIAAYRRRPGDPRSLSYDRIRSMIEDKDGALWIGTFGGGVNRLDPESLTFTRYQSSEKDPGSLSDNTVRAILEDSDGRLWFGTNGGGLDLLDRETGRFRHFRNDAHDPASLSNDFIYCLMEDMDGRLWIGTWGGGLNKLDRKTGKFSRFTTADGLACNEIVGMVQDRSGDIWLTTNDGLTRFTPQIGRFRNYDVSDGLQGREFNINACYQGRSGRIFIGGANGIDAFFPESIADNNYIPPIRITSFKVLNKEARLERAIWGIGEITLSPRDYLFSFEFAALDYSAPEKNRYAFKMEGVTDDWIHSDSRNRIASFSTLDPGTYVFRVKGSNSDGVWNEQGASLLVRVLPPWWSSWWFRLLLAALAFLSFYQWKRTHLRRLAARIRTEAAMDQLCVRFSISAREREIIILMLKGKTNREIEEALFIALGTVKNHVYRIFQKLGIKNRSQLQHLFQNLQIK